MRSVRALLLLVALVPAAARATWYQENIEGGSEIIMMDLRWPWWCSGTYYANWNTGFVGAPSSMSFYGGFLAMAPDAPGGKPNLDPKIQDGFRPGSVWSFWGGSPDGRPVEFIESAPNLFLKNVYGAEGASGSLGAQNWKFIRSGRWYTMLGRVWRPADPKATHSYVGRWVKDQADGRWHLIGIARLPAPVTAFSGNAGFIETLSDGRVVRPLHRRFGYFCKDGAWGKSDTITINETPYVVVNVVPEGDHDYAAIEYAATTDNLPAALEGKPLTDKDDHSFTTRQPDRPVLDKPAVKGVRARASASQVAAVWEIPDTAAPMLGYRIEVFADAACGGEPLSVKEERMPTAREALVDVDPPAGAAIRLTVTDIFDQRAEPVVVAVEPPRPPAAAARAAAEDTIEGLAYELFIKDSTRPENYWDTPVQQPNEQHHWLTLAELAEGKLVRQGLARGFDLGVLEQRQAGYAVVFRGLLRVPADGLYLLRARIDGGYRIRIGDRNVITWDGQHGSSFKTGFANLAAGDHELEVTYLYDRMPGRNFTIEWEGPGLPRQPIPLDALRVPDVNAYPVPDVAARAPGDGTGSVTVTVDPNGHTVNRTAIYLGSLELAAADGPKLEFAGPLPRGEVVLWSRVTFDGDRSVDSAPVTLDVTGRPVGGGWTVRNVGDSASQAGLWQTGDNEFLFFGNGMHTLSRAITGDFTATCRIDDFNGKRGEPVNGRAWVGLSARSNPDALNWGWGRDFHVVQTAREGIRASAEFSDLGSGRLSTHHLEPGPWIRIVRQGQVWTGWTSADGKAWTLGSYQWRPVGEALHVGLFFSALPQDARAHYYARVSDLSLVPGVLPESMAPQPAPAASAGGERITGVALARSDANVVVVRTSHAGLLRSTDGGKTWKAANGDLAGAALAVRSVAIHPSDPATMLLAAGRGGEGGLWKTADGGATWQRLPLEGDFDGEGPSALGGEAVAFDPRSPDVIYAGCESKGFFRSDDGGATWRRLGLEGERVTAVRIWEWEPYYPALTNGRTEICVTTSADHWMTFLGRGKPATRTEAEVSKVYVSGDGVQTLAALHARTDTGFHDAAWDKSLQSTREISYATTHGYEHDSGGHMSLFPPVKQFEWLRPFVALGTTAKGEGRDGVFYTQALDPEVPGRLTAGRGGWGMSWAFLQLAGEVPKGGLVACAGELQQGQTWWFVFTDGLYRSFDGGVTLSRVLDAQGRQAGGEE